MVPLLFAASSAFVPMGTIILRANTRSTRSSTATCISPPLPGITLLASSAAIAHMSQSGSEIATASSMLVLVAMSFLFAGGLFTDEQRLKPLRHLKGESQAGAAAISRLASNPPLTTQECVMVPTPAAFLKDGADRDWWICPPGVTPPPFLNGRFSVDRCAEVYYNGELTYACSFN